MPDCMKMDREEINAAWDSAEYNAQRARRAEETLERVRKALARNLTPANKVKAIHAIVSQKSGIG
jgi:hypothetical protein